MQSFPDTETEYLLPGPTGLLQVVAAPADPGTARHKSLVICHPHPLYGGTMNNKVVTTVFRTFRAAGFDVVRFNYRGVGRSEGVYDESRGETDDLLAVIAWLEQLKPQQPLWLAGFSFGSFVAAKGALRSSCEQLISLAPAAHHNDFAGLPTMTCPWLVIQPEADEVVPPQSVYDWVAHRPTATEIKLIRIPEASHFFHGKLILLRDTLLTELGLTS
jgi:alpha/beta superfamily hydrolase